MPHHKEWKSYNELITLLQTRGLQIDQENTAYRYLKNIGYYRLSGYWNVFRQQNEDGSLSSRFIENSRFSDIMDLYFFDKKLRLLTLDALEHIELSIRTNLAHQLGEKHPCAHQKPQFFKTRLKRNSQITYQTLLERYQTLEKQSDKKPLVQHNRKKYKELPIWAASELWDFGMLSYLYALLKDPQMGIRIADQYGFNSHKSFSQCLRSLNYLRNVSAHHSRLWNINITVRTPVLAAGGYPYLKKIDNNKPFYYLCLIKVLMDIIYPDSAWGNRFLHLAKGFPSSQVIAFAECGAPEGWQGWSLWQKKADA